MDLTGKLQNLAFAKIIIVHPLEFPIICKLVVVFRHFQQQFVFLLVQPLRQLVVAGVDF